MSVILLKPEVYAIGTVTMMFLFKILFFLCSPNHVCLNIQSVLYQLDR